MLAIAKGLAGVLATARELALALAGALALVMGMAKVVATARAWDGVKVRATARARVLAVVKSNKHEPYRVHRA